MEIQTLRYAVTLAEELHFGRAAQRHFISAQPFGQHIKRLEREVGTRLFERTSRRVRLTPAGELFVDRARTVLAQVALLQEAAAEDARSDEGALRIGLLGFGAADRWQDLRTMAQMQQQRLTLVYQDLDIVDQYDALRRGEVDVAVLQYVGGLDGLDFEPFLSYPRVAVVPASSPLADASFLTASDLSNYRWLNVSSHEPLLRSWAGAPDAGTGASVRHPAAIPAAVAATGSVFVHSEPAARYFSHPDVRFISLEGTPAQLAVATRTGDRRPGAEAFRRAAAAVRMIASV
jgi:DNA-binding transcriptional LysR family regulator